MKIVKKYYKRLVLAAVSLVCSAASVAQNLSDDLSNGEALALSTGVGGQVASVLVKPGEQVKKGQLLLSLSTISYQSRLDATQAVQTHARFKLQLVEADYARQQELYEEGSLSAVELQQLDLQVMQSRMQLAAANAAVDVATANLAFANIVAPADGQITAVPLVGQRVNINAGLPVLIKMSLD